VSALLSKYPESAYEVTNLGELPLHLAVDKACAPEVVNLIIVANWKAIVTQDQAGRTPLDIINRCELLQLEDYRIVFESLTRCHKTFIEMQKASQDEQASLKRKQKATFNAVSKRHQEEIRSEREKQAKLESDVEALKRQIEDLKRISKAKDNEIETHQTEKEKLMNFIQDLDEKATRLSRQLQTRKDEIKRLLDKIEQKDKIIAIKEKEIDTLSKDLRGIAVANETDIMECLVEAEESMRNMVSKQIALQNMLTDNAKGLQELLSLRGIALPAVNDKIENDEEKKIDDGDPVIERDKANAAMMAAAMAALNPAMN
jgi:predicted RNase H-like nuclease (RuvC/YqgF family)